MNALYDHVVLISLDTLRSDALGPALSKLWPHKYSVSHRPNTEPVDRLARDGAFFPDCISAAPYTSASHASYFTGRWPPRHGVFEFFNRKLAAPTLFSHARGVGFRTVFKTDFPLILGPFLGFDRGVDEYIIEDDEAFLKALRSPGPTVSFAHFGGIHVPYGFHNRHYGGADYEAKLATLEDGLPLLAGNPADRLVETYRDAEDLRLLLRYKRVVQHYYSKGDYNFLFSLYLEGISHFIRTRFAPFLERLLDQLSGRRFLLVLFGDHGEEYDELSYGHHNTLSEGVLRVPVVFFGGDVRPGTHARRIRSIDVGATIMEALGVNLGRASLDGASLLSTVRGGDPYPERTAFAQAYTSDTQEFVRYQERLLNRGRKAGRLRHVLYQEAVYESDLKLTRRYHRYAEHGGISGLEACPPVTVLERFDEEGVPRAFRNPEAEAQLLASLGEYRRLHRTEGAALPLTEDIRVRLNALGYRV